MISIFQALEDIETDNERPRAKGRGPLESHPYTAKVSRYTTLGQVTRSGAADILTPQMHSTD